MNRKAEFIKANKQLLGKGLDYIVLDRKYIEWLEQKLASAEAKKASHNTAYEQCEDCGSKNVQANCVCRECNAEWELMHCT